MVGSPEARSPYLLLDEVDRAREVLILTYTASLEFFERFALSSARSLRALVTVVSDATMVRADPVVVRRAGVHYRDARAVCPGYTAFHPTLLVCVGDGHARVAIGSGNLTMAGWHANAETWTVLRADAVRGSDTLRDVAGFLRALASSPIAFSAQAPEALLRVANELDGLPAEEPGPRLMHSLDAPIINQLPAVHEPVDDLVLYAPFHDGGLHAARRLLDLLQPAVWTVFVQPDTVVDGPALQALVDERGGRLAWVDRRPARVDGSPGRDERYWHGKLVEWRTASGETWALTGSPNLSRPALLAAVGDDGNCELAVLSRIDHDMAPVAGDPPEGGVTNLKRPSGDRDGHRGPVLLAAASVRGTVRVQLHRALAENGAFERYDTGADRWTATAPVIAGADDYELDVSQAPVGHALRLRTASGLLSNEIFVADPARLLRRQLRAIGSVRASPEDVARNGLGRQLLDDIDQLRAHLVAVGATIRGTGGGTRPTDVDDSGGPPADDGMPARPAPGQSLEDFLEACDPVLGRRMTEFALVLPALPGVASELDDEVGTLDTDTDEAAEGGEAGDEREQRRTLTRQLRDLSRDEQQRYGRFVVRLVERSPDYRLVIRTLGLRTLMHSIAARLWPEERWPGLLADALRSLVLAGDEPNEWERRSAASVAAVGLALLRTDVPKMSQRDERQMRYESTARAVLRLLTDRDVEQVALLTGELPGPLEGPAGVDVVEHAVEEALRPPRSVDRAVRLSDDHDVEAQVQGDATIVLVEPLGGLPEPQLVAALRLADETGPVFARAVTEQDRPVLAAWCAPWLAIEKGTKVGKVMIRVWKLSPGQTLHAFTGHATMPRADISVPAGGPRPAKVAELLALADEDFQSNVEALDVEPATPSPDVR